MTPTFPEWQRARGLHRAAARTEMSYYLAARRAQARRQAAALDAAARAFAQVTETFVRDVGPALAGLRLSLARFADQMTAVTTTNEWHRQFVRIKR